MFFPGIQFFISVVNSKDGDKRFMPVKEAIFALLFFFFLVSSPQAGEDMVLNEQNISIKSSNIFGEDEKRVVYNFNPHYLKWVGTLFLPKNAGACTASLVGPDLILTAAHCIYDKKRNKLIKGDYVFYVGRRQNKYLGKSTIVSFSWNHDYEKEIGLWVDKNDWAILRLKKRLGDKLGYFGTKVILDQFHDLNSDVSSVGYSPVHGNERENGNMFFQENCRIREHHLNHSVFFHDCDTGKGDSGGPIVKCLDGDRDCRIVAINVASFRMNAQGELTEYVDEYHYSGLQNVACSAKNFGRKIVKLRKK